MTLIQLYRRWKRPRSSYEGGAVIDYAYAEDSYTFPQYALIHGFGNEEIDTFTSNRLLPYLNELEAENERLRYTLQRVLNARSFSAIDEIVKKALGETK